MIISKTPLRASFFGGGTDFSTYYENSKLGYGTVVSTALDMYVYIIVNRKFDDNIRIVYSGNELVSRVDEVKHNIIREAMKIVGIKKGIEIIYMADVPLSNAGIGLASSSALAVGVLNALHAYKGEFVPQGVLAREACEIEINRLGQRIGIQDQFAVAHGGFSQYKFFNDGSVSITPVVCKKEAMVQLRNNLMLFYTGTTRDSRKILNEQSDTILDKTVMLDELVNTTDRAVQALYDGNQVTVEYNEDGEPSRIDAVVLSAQHDANVTQGQLHEDIKKYVLDPVLPAELIDKNTKFFINPTGRFVIGGPNGDSGLTGRKIIVDTYGGYARHGGGAFSGKDCTKVDRSAAYAARYVAKNIVAAELAAKCEIQLSYAIGVAHPTSIMVDTFGTGKIADDKLVDVIRENFDLRPAGIIKMLDLRKPIYKQTATYGHFGRTDIELPWERMDRVEQLKKYM